MSALVTVAICKSPDGSTVGVMDYNYIPQLALGMWRQLEGIQSHLEAQNNRWLTVEKQLESQSTRMANEPPHEIMVLIT